MPLRAHRGTPTSNEADRLREKDRCPAFGISRAEQSTSQILAVQCLITVQPQDGAPDDFAYLIVNVEIVDNRSDRVGGVDNVDDLFAFEGKRQ